MFKPAIFVVRVLLLALILPLAACATKSVVATQDVVARAAYVAEGPTTLTLYTMINNRSGEGGHSALLINGSQQVLFDPAGSWYHSTAPEQNDLVFGMTPLMVQFYRDYHARETYHVVSQTIEVSPEVAEAAIRAAKARGAVGQAFCAHSVSNILRGLPGFGTIRTTMFPAKLSRHFGKLPGVVTAKQFDTDPDNNKYKLERAALAN